MYNEGETQNLNKAAKEVIKMTKAKRTMTAILSAIMMMTTAAAITASADDTKVSFNALDSDFGTIELT